MGYNSRRRSASYLDPEAVIEFGVRQSLSDIFVLRQQDLWKIL